MSNGQKFLYHVTPSGMEICIQNTLLSSALDQAAVQPLNRVHMRAKESCLQHDCIQEALSSRALGLRVRVRARAKVSCIQYKQYGHIRKSGSLCQFFIRVNRVKLMVMFVKTQV